MTNFLIVGTYRSGSSALAEMLRMHPEVTVGWESTNGTFVSRKLRVAEQVLAGDFHAVEPRERAFLRDLHDSTKTAIGFRRLFRSSDKWVGHPRYAAALFLDRLEGHLKWLSRRRPDVHIIHLVRQDNTAWLRSVGFAKKTDLFGRVPYPEHTEIYWNLRSAEKRVLTKHYIGRRLAELANSNPYLCVQYEELLADNRATAAKVLQFLGYEPEIGSSTTKNAIVQSASTSPEQFINREEVAAHLRTHDLAFELY